MAKTRSRRFMVWALIAFGAVGVAGVAEAQCSRVSASSLYFGETIGVLFSQPLDATKVSRAVSAWSRCANYSSGFPRFVVGESGTRNIRVEYHPETLGKRKCGAFRKGRIELYERMVDRKGRVHDCGSVELNLAHELGHVLGLDDAPRDARCQRHVMSWITPSNAFDRHVQRDECLAVGQTWLTESEWDMYSYGGAPEEVRRFTQGRDW